MHGPRGDVAVLVGQLGLPVLATLKDLHPPLLPISQQRLSTQRLARATNRHSGAASHLLYEHRVDLC